MPDVAASDMPARPALAVKTHEVVCAEDPGDRWPAMQPAMRTMPVVVMEPLGELGAALSRVSIEFRVRPLQQRRLDEAYDLAFRARRVGAREEMPQGQPAAGAAETARPVGRAGSGHD